MKRQISGHDTMSTPLATAVIEEVIAAGAGPPMVMIEEALMIVARQPG